MEIIGVLIDSMNLVAKVMATIGKTNSFHNFHGSGTVASESLEAEEAFGIIKMVEKLSWPTQAVLEAQIVEKVGQDNFFHFFHEFLRKSLES